VAVTSGFDRELFVSDLHRGKYNAQVRDRGAACSQGATRLVRNAFAG
jgi:hypothetical protein